MGIYRLKDLHVIRKESQGVEFKSPQGTRYYYSRARGQVGKETAVKEHQWFALGQNNLLCAKKRIIELINDEEL